MSDNGCDACLRRAHLIGLLSPRIAGLMTERRTREAPGLLTLADHDLIEAVAGEDAREHAVAFLEEFDPAPAREQLERSGLVAVCGHSPRFPDQLRQLDDPPAMLFIRSDRALERLQRLAREPSVAVVGSRRPSGYGLEVARGLGRDLAMAGVPVVSGLALGIDAASHHGALEGRGLAAAVLGGGADVVYPLTNRALYHRVVSSGLVMSEMPPGQRPFRWSFPARNRIMAGLARITLVVEAARDSGSIITTLFADDLGRTIAAVPGRITSRSAAGSNALLHDGALPVLSVQDLLDELFDADDPRRRQRGPRQEELGGPEGAVLEAVSESLDIDAMCSHTGLPAREVRAILSRLERGGMVRRDALGGYRRTARAA
jgi:DNA processing protein